MEEAFLLESASFRYKMCTEERTHILDRIGQLIVLPETGWATKENVALFYQVDTNTIDQLVHRYKNELKSDGYKVLSKKAFENLHHVSFKIPNRGLAVFPRRSVLRLGMILRNSVVAKLVRSYLLNAEEQFAVSSLGRQALQQMVRQLKQHSGQLINNAEELKNQAQQLQSQTKMIEVIVDEIYRNRQRIADVEIATQANREKIMALEKCITGQLEQHDNSHINQEQIKILKQRVKQKGHPCKVWSALRAHFAITRYCFLPQTQFTAALEWLEHYSTT